MSLVDVESFATGSWVGPGSNSRIVRNAVTGEIMARVGGAKLDYTGMLEYARSVGGPSLRSMTFHDRARMIKALAVHLSEHKQKLYDISFATGATQSDHLIDIDGGIGTMLVFASKGRREMPDSCIYMDGNLEPLSRSGSFLGAHICTSLKGVAIHINAFNFPIWGMLEKLAPTLLAGVPAIVKPATVTCYVTELAIKLIAESGILPAGALQMIAGDIGDTISHLTCQDVVSFTGSAATADQLRKIPSITENSIRFIAEQDSLNASILGPGINPDDPEFDLFINEVRREITTKAGQKCTAIRRIIVPENRIDAVVEALSVRLSKTVIGDPALEKTEMGALVSNEQKQDVLKKIGIIESEAERIYGDPDDFAVIGADRHSGAFLPPMLFYCSNPDQAKQIHHVEAFGPVSTIIGYRDLDHAVCIANRADGSLVASVFTRNTNVAREAAINAGAYHGRLYFNNRDSMSEATGHGSPLPHMVHGGPGRAGGGEEMGGIRGVMHYMQRTSIQGSPDIIGAILGKWIPGGCEVKGPAHPFKRHFDELEIGETIYTDSRKISIEDIEHFAEFTGDKFYAHMDHEAAVRSPFFDARVAHGYLILSFAAGLFVDPDEGPVLANTGLDNLRFLKPVLAGDEIKVRLTVKHKTLRNDEYGEIRWHVTIDNQINEIVAEYELLTMNALGNNA